MSELTDFVDTFPQTSLKTALAFIQGQPVTKKAIGLAALNIQSYAMSLFLKDDGPPIPVLAMAATSAVPQAEAEEACKALLPDAGGTMKAMSAEDAKSKWLTLLKTLLPLILDLI